MADQGISKLRGRGSRGGIEFLGSGKCFDAPQHIPWVSVVRVENKIHIGEGGGTRLVQPSLVSTIVLLRTTNPGNIYIYIKLFCHVTTENNQHNSFNLSYHLPILLMEMMTL